MFGWLSLIGTGLSVLKDVSTDIREERKHLKQLDNDQEIQASRERIVALQASADVQIQLLKNHIAAVMIGTIQFLLGLLVVILLYKVIAWDKIIMGGTVRTDDLSASLWNVVYIILGGIFGVGTVRALRK